MVILTQNCLQIVDWLKSWFTPKDEDYQYNITASDYNPNIDSSITITVTVTDGNDNLVDNHSFTLNANGTDVSLTTSNGVATYSYTCSDWGVCRFSVKSYSTQINVTGLKQVKQRVWSSSINLTYTLYADETNRHCSLTITGSSISIASGNANYELTGWIPSEYRPKTNKFTMLNRSQYFQFYAWNNGTIGISNFASTTQSGQGFGGELDWNY